MDKDEEPINKEISILCEQAKQKLLNIYNNAKSSKKQIVLDLAKELEGKIPTDTICVEIITRICENTSISVMKGGGE